jgi:hypothetical protein
MGLAVQNRCPLFSESTGGGGGGFGRGGGPGGGPGGFGMLAIDMSILR